MQRDAGSIPGSGRFPGEDNGNPLQYFCLENFLDRIPWQTSPWGCRVGHDWSSRHTHTWKEKGRRNSRYLAKICGECSAVHTSLQPRGPTRLCCPGISQVKISQWVAISYYRESSRPRYQTSIFCVFCTGRQILHPSATWASKAKMGPKQLGRWLNYLSTWVRREEKWTYKYNLYNF